MSQENERWENCPEISCHSNDRKRVFGHCVNPQTTHPWHSVPPKPAPSAAVTADKGLERLIKFLNICDECDEPAMNCFCDAHYARAAQPDAQFDEDKFLLQITNDISYEKRFNKGPIWLALTIMQRVAALLGKEPR